MTADKEATVGKASNAELGEVVDSTLRDVLGYTPAPDENLSAMDSLQKLELLVAFEESLSLPFDDEALAAAWWGTRDAMVAHLREVRAEPSRP